MSTPPEFVGTAPMAPDAAQASTEIGAEIGAEWVDTRDYDGALDAAAGVLVGVALGLLALAALAFTMLVLAP